MSMHEPSMKTVSFDGKVCSFMISMALFCPNEIVIWNGVSFSRLSLSLKTLPLEQKHYDISVQTILYFLFCSFGIISEEIQQYKPLPDPPQDPVLELIMDGVSVDCEGKFKSLGWVSWLTIGPSLSRNLWPDLKLVWCFLKCFFGLEIEKNGIPFHVHSIKIPIKIHFQKGFQSVCWRPWQLDGHVKRSKWSRVTWSQGEWWMLVFEAQGERGTS